MLNRQESLSLSYVFPPEKVARMRRTIKKLQMVSYGGTKLKPSHGDVGSSFRRSPERKQEHIVAVFNRAAAELRAARAHIQEAMSGELTGDVSLDPSASTFQEQPTQESVKPEPLVVPLINFFPQELRQMATG